MKKQKILVVRLSSFGDVIQSLVVLEPLKKKFPNSEIHWLVRKDYEDLLMDHPLIDKLWSFDPKWGFKGLLEISNNFKKEKYSHIYDAHNNTRSNILKFLLLFHIVINRVQFCVRPKNRFKRLLLFKFGINKFPWPFVLLKSYLEPLKKWGISKELPPSDHIYLKQNDQSQANELTKDLNNFIVMAPSAAWDLKRWPQENWLKLINLLKDRDIVLLGGPSDHFIDEIVQNSEDRNAKLINFAGKTSYAVSCGIIKNSQITVSGDTGLLHVADQYRLPAICFIGAAAFAYPARENTLILDVKLKCKPCSKDGRGKCKNEVFKKCLVDITPEQVAKHIQTMHWI